MTVRVHVNEEGTRGGYLQVKEKRRRQGKE